MSTPYADPMDSDLTTRGTPRKRFPREVRREQLIDVAEEMFIQHGYSGVTMEDLRRAAGVSRPVLYDHFPTREAVYLACVERARQQYNEELLGAFDPDADPKTQLRQGAEVFFSALENQPGRWQLIFGSSAVLPETHAAVLAALRFETISAVEGLLRHALPDAPALGAKIAAHAISGVGERLGLLWLNEPQLTKQDLIDHYVDILWSGLALYVES